MTFAEQLENARQAAGLTQAQVAELAGVSRQSVNVWLQGGTPPLELYQKAILAEIAKSGTAKPGKPSPGKVQLEKVMGGWRLVDADGIPIEQPIITASHPIYPTKQAAKLRAKSLS